MKKVKIGENNYELIDNYKDAFNLEETQSLMTDYFETYDYVIGDYSYDKLRLKGFYDSSNKNCKPVNDFQKYEEYIKKYCSYECRYFILKKCD